MTSMGPDLDEFRAAVGRPGYRCRIPAIIASLDADHAERLRAALAAPDIQSAAILRIVNRWGVDIRYNSIRRHRAKECACA